MIGDQPVKGEFNLTGKARVRAAFAHQETDRVPLSMRCVETAWENLKNYLQVDSEEAVMQHFDIDIRSLDLPPYIGPELPPPYENEHGELVVPNFFGGKTVRKWNGVEYNWLHIEHPYDCIQSMADFERFTGWPDPDHFDYAAVARFVAAHQDKAIRIGWPGPYQVFTLLYDTETFYINMIEEPELLKAMLDRFCQSFLEIYDRMFEAAQGAIDILCCCDDYGTQISTLFSPAMWNDFFAENTKKLVQLAHRHGAFYMQHSCGAVRPIIPNLLACGIDALDPIQKVAGMEVDRLKADFGHALLFHGGIDTQGVLPFGTPQDVFAETTRVIEALGQDGGFILCGSQDFEGDVPPENICALYEAARLFRR